MIAFERRASTGLFNLLRRSDLTYLLPANADVVLYSMGHAKVVEIGWSGYGVLTEACAYVSDRAPFAPHDLERLTSAYKRALASGGKFAYEPSRRLDARKPPVGSRTSDVPEGCRVAGAHPRQVSEVPT